MYLLQGKRTQPRTENCASIVYAVGSGVFVAGSVVTGVAVLDADGGVVKRMRFDEFNGNANEAEFSQLYPYIFCSP
jgi:hypothetical protein